ncbi:GNAT family N-acetyltransferase [Ruegeria arenilitoris]|uniref:GNAT family N-acetyltransferase n=1 Tax=Ruegeria arenilitoris TaxID=1173585 RepID=UPI0020C50375|nr:GNAT family protein [Ruegeria arenilitoris]
MPDKPISVFKLRPLEKADLEAITPWFQDIEDLARFDRTSRIPFNLAQTEEIWSDAFNASGSCCKCWFAVESDSGQVLGLAGLEAISSINRDAVVAIFVEKSARRLGLAIRATALVVDFAFRQLGLNRLTSYYRDDNHISRDLVERLGCQVEGTMRQAWYADGTFHDMIVVGVLKQDWMDRRPILAKELDPGTIVTFGADGISGWSWPPQVDECE